MRFDRGTWRRIHRWCGLLVAAFLVFYALTGLLLNHRQSFGYFTKTSREVAAMEPLATDGLQELLDMCKKRIGRQDDPKVIRIPDRDTIEFLYGSHGKTTYRLQPATGRIEKSEKEPVEPFDFLNGLHKASGVTDFWLFFTDILSILVLLLTASGLVVQRYTKRDILLLAGSVFFLFLAMGVA